MLPAFCSPDGVTIVVVLLVALRGKESRIESWVWRSGEANWAVSIVFVTPESAVTKGFQTFVNRLLGRQQLDRVVVDECHTVLDSGQDFRPQLGSRAIVCCRFDLKSHPTPWHTKNPWGRNNLHRNDLEIYTKPVKTGINLIAD
jgi:superfamily II DNA helicase RecQ